MMLLVATNVAALANLSLQWSTLIGVVNGSLAATLLFCSFWRPGMYAHCRCTPAQHTPAKAWPHWWALASAAAWHVTIGPTLLC